MYRSYGTHLKKRAILRRIEIRRYKMSRPYGTSNPFQRLTRINH